MWESEFQAVLRGDGPASLTRLKQKESAALSSHQRLWARGFGVLQALCPLGEMTLLGVRVDGRFTSLASLPAAPKAPLPQTFQALKESGIAVRELMLVAAFTMGDMEYVLELSIESTGKDDTVAFTLSLIGNVPAFRPGRGESARSYVVRIRRCLNELEVGSKWYEAFDRALMRIAKHLKGMAEEVRLSFGDLCLSLICPNEERVGLFRHLTFVDTPGVEPALFDDGSGTSPYLRPAYRFAYDTYEDLRSYIWLDAMLADHLVWPSTYLHVVTPQGKRLGVHHAFLKDLGAHLPSQALAFGAEGELIVSENIPHIWPT